MRISPERGRVEPDGQAPGRVDMMAEREQQPAKRPVGQRSPPAVGAKCLGDLTGGWDTSGGQMRGVEDELA